ncbi:MAG: NEW3 domain-containing protein [Planctomycetota bacterium]|jgi:hypothetical protein
MLNRFGQIILVVCLFGGSACDATVDVRAENFTVPPSTGPVTHILIRNSGNAATAVVVEPKFPDGWRWSPKERAATIEAGQTQRLAFAIEKANDTKSNEYTIEIGIRNGSEVKVHGQQIVCASAPYFKPKIDGKFKDWADAIPATFVTKDKKTIVSTYWNKKQFCLYVQFEEAKLYGYKKDATQIDAVQFALATTKAITPTSPDEKAQRYEFLLVDSGKKDKCFALIKPDDGLAVTQQQRPLEPLEFEDAEIVVKRKGSITSYECAIPFSAMRQIRPDVGRQIAFSILVHDPDGTGVRDWGKAAGLWPEQKNPLAWSRWGSGDWPAETLYDSKLEWGLCSSKH